MHSKWKETKTPGPNLKNKKSNMQKKEGGKSQNLKLLRRGKAMSGAPSIKGTNQFAKPPINIGITIKKIIKKASEEIKLL